MKKEYRPSDFELAHYQRWKQAGYFRPSGEGEPFCIVIPPPNVTGTLHMGHAFQDTIMDALTRYHRMRRRNTLWQPGTDHAGIATEMVVTRLLAAEGIAKADLGREKFIERVWEWKHRSGGTIAQQLTRLGCSVDWERDRFTMDPGLSAAVAKVFCDLYDEGLVYRGKRLVNWDPVLKTVLSDLEVLATEERGKLWRFRYPLEDGSGYLVVATTRPETMLGDTAVAVHPEDERYRHLIGRCVRLPLAERSIPIVADDYVDREFGTGCVKITPAHDFNDYEVGQRHSLPLLNVFDASARMNDAVPERYRGLDRFEARKRVLADLEAAGLLDGIDDHTLMVPRAERSGAVVEPYLTDQWYVRMQPLAEPAIAAVESGRVRFVPDNWSKIYFDWMRNIQDWCISRQLWWGHRVPAWYGPDEQIYVAPTEAEARAKYSLGEDVPLRQDDDVFDTWFSSALWPFSTMGWPEKTPELRTFYPTSVLVTGFDIIFFWVARMIMMGLKFAGDVPFRDVYIHGLIRDQDGQKMSKSKGNVLDPLDLVDGVDLETLVKKRTEGLMQPHLKPKIEKATRKEFPEGIRPYGADALRLTYASLATTGQDLRFDFGRIDGNHRFCNKLWNATSYVLAQLESAAPAAAPEPGAAERWIRSRLGRTIRAVHEHYAAYRLDLVQQALYDFTWHELCDWYLELTKPILNDPEVSPARLAATRATLAEALGAVLKLLHPMIPFVTEELWLELAAKTGVPSETVMLERLPEAEDFPEDDAAEAEIAWLKEFVVGIRQIRGEMSIARSVALPVKLAGASPEDAARARRHDAYVRKLANLSSVEVVEDGAAVRGAATALLGKMRILVPLEGLVDIAAERERLSKQLERVQADHDKCRRKLDNADFAANAPEQVVAKERARAAELEQRAAQLSQQLERLAELQ